MLIGNPDKNVNGYDLTGIGEMKGEDIDNQQKILDSIDKSINRYEKYLKSEEDRIVTLTEQNDDLSLNTIKQIEKNSIPSYKRLIAFIKDTIKPYYENLDDYEDFYKNVKEYDIISLIEYYIYKENVDITTMDTSGFEYRTILNTVHYDTPKLVRQNDPVKNDAGTMNEALFSKFELNSSGDINPSPYLEKSKKFETHDIKTDSGDLYEVKSVFKIREDGKKYSRYAFYVPVEKIQKLEEYKQSHPNNIVRIYWQTIDDKPSTFIKNAKGILKDDYKKNLYYLNIKDKDTLDDKYIVEAYSKPGINQDSYELGEYNIDKYADDSTKFIQKVVPLDALEEFYKLPSSSKELPDFMLLTDEEKQYYLRERLNGGNPHFILRDIFHPEKYRQILDQRFEQQNKKVTKKVTKKKMSKKKH